MKKFFLVVCVLVFVTACGAAESPGAVSAHPTDTPISPTSTLEPTDTPKPPTATPTFTPLPPTDTSTPTPIPPTSTLEIVNACRPGQKNLELFFIWEIRNGLQCVQKMAKAQS